MSEEERASYYAIIPAPVRYDEELTANAKLLYGEITALCNKNGYCWASNNYFAKLYKCTPQAISKWTKALESKKYISITYVTKEGSKEIEQRLIYLTDKVSTNIDRVSTNVSEVSTNVDGGYQQKVKENNTSINNTSNKKKESKKEETFDTIICSMIHNDELKELTYEFIKMRKLIKAPLTNRALKMMIKELYQISTNDEERIKILSKSIMNNWKGVFPLKQPIRKEVVPEWFDKKIEKEQLPDDELEELQKELASFNDDWKEEAKALKQELEEKY